VDFTISSSFAKSGKEEQDYAAVVSWTSLRIAQDSSFACIAACQSSASSTLQEWGWKNLCSSMDLNTSNSSTTCTTKGFS